MHKFNLFFQRFFIFIQGIILSIFLICFSVWTLLIAKPFYYLHINTLDLTTKSGVSADQIKHNYDILIKYLTNSSIKELNFTAFGSSNEGLIHFEDVRNIFSLLFIIMIITLIISLILFIISFLKKQCSFLLVTSISNIIIPLFISLPLIIDFDSSFERFHEIFFSNDYWLFDPNKDEIINVLPIEFFRNSAIFILTFIIISSILSFILYKLLKQKNISTQNKI